MKNWRTTLSGVALIVTGAVLLILDIITWEASLTFFMPGIGLLVAKDHNVSGK